MTAPPSSLLPPTDDELHAFVDGRLTPKQAQRLQAKLDADPATADTVAAWQAQREQLRLHLSEVLDEPVPPHLAATAAEMDARKHVAARWSRWGGMAAGLLLAFGAGWMAHSQWPAPRQGDMVASNTVGFARQALVAHAVYTPEQRHPVEVGAAEQDHLLQWLSKRLGRSLRLPQLDSEGFELVGGRLLPGDSGARAQFMFESSAGERLTLYVAPQPRDALPGTVEFRFVADGGIASFYWIEGGLGYALTGAMPRARLMALAQLTHRALRP